MKRLRESGGIALEGLLEIEPVFKAITEEIEVREPELQREISDVFPMPLVSGFRKMTEQMAVRINQGLSEKRISRGFADIGTTVLLNERQGKLALDALCQQLYKMREGDIQDRGLAESGAAVEKHLKGEGEEFARPVPGSSSEITVLFDLSVFNPADGSFSVEVI